MKRMILPLLLLLSPLFASAQDKPAAPDRPVITLFYSEHCGACLRLRREVLPEIREHYLGRVEWDERCTDEPEHLAALFAVTKQYLGEHTAARVPAVVIGGRLLVGGEIKPNLETAIEELLAGKTEEYDTQYSGADLKKEFSAFSPSAVAVSGLIDGINPCAFAVIVFFISFLAVYGYSKKEIAVVGSAYCLGVFVAYMVIGLGILKALYALSGFYVAMKVFYYLMALACFIFAAFSLKDYYLYKTTGSAEGFALQLPQALKLKINKVMGLLRRRDGSLGLPRLFAAAFVVGLMVSVIEAVCTGQVYVPTIAYIMKDPQLRSTALGYLLLYNLMFIVPLIIVFALSLAGCSSERFSGFFKQRLGLSKLLLAGLFLLLGVLLLILS